MTAIQPNSQIDNEYSIWSDRSNMAFVVSMACAGGVGGALSLGAYALLTPNDAEGRLVTMGTTTLASATGVLAGRLIDMVEESDSQSLKTMARTAAGVIGGVGLAFSVANTINIVNKGDLMSVQQQLDFSLIGALAGGIFGKFTTRWGCGLINIGTSMSVTSCLTIVASIALPSYKHLTPIPMALSFSSLVCHPFKTKIT